jgi:16S rRNA (adenine(1408)-N(1))-methyltransferase
VTKSARLEPRAFFIGIDANVKPLEKPSMRATRNPTKGGLPNALFLHAAVEKLPAELDAVARRIHVYFPWGSLLKSVATIDPEFLISLRRVSSADCVLEIVIGIDPERDGSEIERLGLPYIDDEYVNGSLVPKYAAFGFELLEHRMLDATEWTRLGSSWAKKLSANKHRLVRRLLFQNISGHDSYRA